MEPIQLEITILGPREKVWRFFTEPQHIVKWNFAHESWHCPKAVNDVKPNGTFNFRMEARDQSIGFDFKGIYDEVIPFEKISYHLEDGRKVTNIFEEVDMETTRVIQIFEPEDNNTREMQRQGWYNILNNFHKYVEHH